MAVDDTPSEEPQPQSRSRSRSTRTDRRHGELDGTTTARTDTTVSVVIPTYNEAENVRRVVDRCRAALADYAFEVLVVDDDSPDRTWAVARRAFGDDPRVQVVRRTDERGLATAVSRGFTEADGELCAVLDADLQHPPERLPDLLEAFDDGTDLVVGSRHVADGGVENWPLARRVVSRGARLLARAALPAARHLSDPMSGFFVVRRGVLSDVTLSPTGYKILLEILVRCPVDGVREVPYVFVERERGDSKLTSQEYGNFLRHLLDLRLTADADSTPDRSETTDERATSG